jgi:hypothetical protein
VDRAVDAPFLAHPGDRDERSEIRASKTGVWGQLQIE